MDKASILADTIDCVKGFRNEADTVQAEIQSVTHSGKQSDGPAMEETNSLTIEPAFGCIERLLEVDASVRDLKNPLLQERSQ